MKICDGYKILDPNNIKQEYLTFNDKILNIC